MSERKTHDPRYCQTHALVNGMFAQTGTQRAIVKAWEFNATAWADLAELRIRLNRERLTARWYNLPPG